MNTIEMASMHFPFFHSRLAREMKLAVIPNRPSQADFDELSVGS